MGRTKRCALFVGSCSDRLTSKEMSKKRSEVESKEGDRAQLQSGGQELEENKGFGWSTMKYLGGLQDCRVSESASLDALLWGCSKRRAFWKWIGGVASGSRTLKVGLICGGGDDDRAGQGWDGLSARETSEALQLNLRVTCSSRDREGRGVCPGIYIGKLPLRFSRKGRKQGREARS